MVVVALRHGRSVTAYSGYNVHSQGQPHIPRTPFLYNTSGICVCTELKHFMNNLFVQYT